MVSGSLDLRRNLYHLVFVPKCRFNVFKNERTVQACRDAFSEVERSCGIRLEEIEFQENHVHLMAHIPAKVSVSLAVQLLKGVSARRVFEKLPKLRNRYPRGSFWSRFKFYGTVGPMTVETVRKYIHAQDVHHERLVNPEAGQLQLSAFFG